MNGNNELVDKDIIKEKINHIIELTGLEVAGFAELTKISDSHIYALLNGGKTLSPEIAEKIALPLKMKASQILDISYTIPDSIRNAAPLKKFYQTFKKSNPEYFRETKVLRTNTYYIEEKLLPGTLFNEPVGVSDVVKVCSDNGISLAPKQVSQKLSYLVRIKELKSEKRKLKKKNGELSDREVLVYFKPKPGEDSDDIPAAQNEAPDHINDGDDHHNKTSDDKEGGNSANQK